MAIDFRAQKCILSRHQVIPPPRLCAAGRHNVRFLIDAVELFQHVYRHHRRKLGVCKEEVQYCRTEHHRSGAHRAAQTRGLPFDFFHVCTTLSGSGISTSMRSPRRS